MPDKSRDVYYLAKTIRLARIAEGFTSPNPLVGALIVKNNKVLASGYHKRCGLPHAEIQAIRRAPKKQIKNATLYVNLEPCCHFGRTPPCVDEIIRQGFKRVVIANLDPNPLVSGKSVRKLKNAGVSVSRGLLQAEAARLNEVFFKTIRQKMPFVAVKIAQSLDGKIRTAGGQSQWITSKPSRNYARGLRDRYDCVLVGINTILSDDPLLKGKRRIPYKVILDPGLRLPARAKILQYHPEKVVVFSSYASRRSRKLKKLPAGLKIHFLKTLKGQFRLREVLKILFREGAMSVFVEGGSCTVGGFFDERLVDKVYWFIAAKIIGGEGALSSVGGQGINSLAKPCLVTDPLIEGIGKDFLVTGYPRFANRERS